jgi:hypothetical protein
MNPLIQPKQRTSVFLIASALACLGLVDNMQAVDPPPDGGYSGANTAEGTDALLNLTSGIANTAVGFDALLNNAAGNVIETHEHRGDFKEF